MNSKRVSLVEILDDSLLCIQERKATVDDCLRSHPDVALDLKPLLETAVDIQDHMAPSGPPLEFQLASEARLKKKLRTAIPAGKERALVRPLPPRRIWIRAAAVVLTLAVLFASGGGVAAASARAIPGDPLYPVKREIEQVRLAFSWTAAGDVSLLAQYSDERLREVQELVQAGRETDLPAGLEAYEKTLGLLDDAIQHLSPNSDSGLMENTQTRLSDHATILLDLRARVAPATQEKMDQAIDRSLQSQELIQSLQQGKGPINNPLGKEKSATKELTANKELAETKELTATKEPTETKEPTATKEPKETKEPKATKEPK